MMQSIVSGDGGGEDVVKRNITGYTTGEQCFRRRRMRRRRRRKRRRERRKW
jgi:hypothetical protein